MSDKELLDDLFEEMSEDADSEKAIDSMYFIGPKTRAALLALRERDTRLQEVLIDAHSDISDWVQFAKRQLRELPNVDHLPCGPTNNGVEVSERLMERISDTLWPRSPPSE